MTDAISTRRFRPTPDRCVLLLLLVEALLFLSNWLGWPAWHKGYAVLTGVAVVGAAMVLMLVWFVVASLLRWRFQFSVRCLLVLAAVVAMPCSWLAVEMKRANGQMKEAEGVGSGYLRYDWEVDADGNYREFAEPPQGPPAWVWNLFGRDFFADVVCVNGFEMPGGEGKLTDAHLLHAGKLDQLRTVSIWSTGITDLGLKQLTGLGKLETLNLVCSNVTDIGLIHLEKLVRLRTLGLAGTQVTDVGLQHIEGLVQLENLDLSQTAVTDGGLSHFRPMVHLKKLDLNHSGVTDVGLSHLVGLTQLQQLNLSCTQVTDAGLKYLAGLTRLQEIDLRLTEVTDEGVLKLQQTLPNCKIKLADDPVIPVTRSGLF